MPNKRKPSKKKKKQKVNMQSADIAADRLARLRDLLPEAFTESKVDFDKLRQALGDEVDDRPERYTFTWAGKRDAMRLLQVPSRATLVPCPKESVDWDATQNLFIEGENLEVLKLLYKSYAGRVKMIYIDPPYNTGNDFIYPDDFRDPLEAYLKLTAQKDSEGNLLTSNPETSGRYHSAWLSMMYPRLFAARQLLREDGVIFVSIDDREVHDLRLLMNEIFGEECFKNCIVFKRGIKSVQAQFDTVDALNVGHEYIVMYARDRGARFKHLRILLDDAKEGYWNNHWRGTNRPSMRYELFGVKPERGQWRWSEARSLQAAANYERMLNELHVKPEEITQEQIDAWYEKECGRLGEEIDLLRLSTSGKPEHFISPSDTKIGSDLWTDLSPRGTSELTALFGVPVFDNPKPVGLIRRMLDFATDISSGHLVLDFFAGSSTTAHALLDENRDDGGNRRFILVQLQEPVSDSTEAGKNAIRLGLKTIADIGKERIRRVIKKLKAAAKGNLDLKDRETPEDLGFRVFKLSESNYRPWKGVEKKDGAAYADTMEMFADPLLPGWKPVNVLYEVALKEGYSLNSKIEKVKQIKDNTVWCVTDPDKGQSFRICLDDKLKPATLKALALKKDDLFICRDSALTDEQAANLALQCNLKTI